MNPHPKPWIGQIGDVTRDAGDLVQLLRSDALAVRTAKILLGGIVAIILANILAEVASPISAIARRLAITVSLNREGGVAESLNHGVAFLAAAVFLLAFLAHGSRLLLWLSALMAFIWVDDSFRYHERLGEFLDSVYTFPTMAGARTRDTGELLAWAIAALVLGAMLVVSWGKRRGGDGGLLAIVGLVFASLVFFGVVVDFLHSLVPTQFDFAMTVIEDGGEMISVALLALLAIGVMRNGGPYYETRAHDGFVA